MRMVDLIIKKRDNNALAKEEIEYMINGYTKGDIPDYQMSAMAMAIFFNGMNNEESTNLAIAMLNSGDKIDLSSIKGVKVDKHSTGGVGDKTTLVLTPLIAALGVKVAKMSGRGLGHTGGTLDKLESIPGFNINLDNQTFINQVNNIGLAVIGQTGNLTPADKLLYALRDVTGTVDSIPLIASSIMSKKLAAGSDVIHLDVKVGSGAFMKNKDDALKLAKLMVDIGKMAGKKTTAILTNMDEPLGYAVGNSLEVIEAINTLKGQGPKDLHDLCIEIGSHLVLDANITKSVVEAKTMLNKAITDGKGLDKFAEMVKAQGGDETYIYHPEKFALGKIVKEVKALKDGFIERIDALEIGISAMILGAGRETKDAFIDKEVGIVLNKKVGDKVKTGDLLATIYSNGKGTNEASYKTAQAFTISNKEIHEDLIIDVVR